MRVGKGSISKPDSKIIHNKTNIQGLSKGYFKFFFLT